MISKFIKYIIAILIIINIQKSYSEELFINASTVEIDKTGQIVYAKGNVEIFDKDTNNSLENSIFFKENDITKKTQTKKWEQRGG